MRFIPVSACFVIGFDMKMKTHKIKLAPYFLATAFLFYLFFMSQANQDMSAKNFVADLVFVCDNSKAISREMFIEEKLFMKNILKKISVNDDSVRVALIKYQKMMKVRMLSALLVSSFSMFTSHDEIYKQIEDIKLMNKMKNISDAFQLVDEKVFKLSAGDRPSVPNVIILFTDDHSPVQKCEPHLWAEKLKWKKHKIFVVMIATSNLTNSRDKRKNLYNYLRNKIASEPDLFFILSKQVDIETNADIFVAKLLTKVQSFYFASKISENSSYEVPAYETNHIFKKMVNVSEENDLNLLLMNNYTTTITSSTSEGYLTSSVKVKDTKNSQKMEITGSTWPAPVETIVGRNEENEVVDSKLTFDHEKSIIEKADVNDLPKETNTVEFIESSTGITLNFTENDMISTTFEEESELRFDYADYSNFSKNVKEDTTTMENDDLLVPTETTHHLFVEYNTESDYEGNNVNSNSVQTTEIAEDYAVTLWPETMNTEIIDADVAIKETLEAVENATFVEILESDAPKNNESQITATENYNASETGTAGYYGSDNKKNNSGIRVDNPMGSRNYSRFTNEEASYAIPGAVLVAMPIISCQKINNRTDENTDDISTVADSDLAFSPFLNYIEAKDIPFIDDTSS
ncbi:von Willebrand factor [Trichinella pseudospiralis]|uniref:von Willebrand factor n=1 Tax=Trichinella pseudospiralis TaxID=6337 RepID=A0A0V1EZZ2_TRIPS|nr:von Willebrand factor [Trichinella pseudospiralis]